jgi:hypothetical protein
MKRAALFVAGLVIAASAAAAKFDSDVTIKNDSAWTLVNLYMSAADENEWGPDQLGEQVIETGGSFKIHSIPCDSYDIKIVDEDGDECVIGGVDVCADSNTWTVSDDDLLACQAETE